MKGPPCVVLALAVVLASLGCWTKPPEGGGVVVAEAIAANNAAVSVLNRAQEGARASRKALLETIARSAPSRPEGERQMDVVDARYAPVFALFQKAEAIQTRLADALEVARALANEGKEPPLEEIVRLYAALQEVHAEILSRLGGPRG